MTTTSTPAELIARSNRLGSDPKVTNYAGGNTSAKGTATDPVTGEPVELLWVKGSGGDLGTLTEKGLAVLRLDRMRALVDVYPGVEREDEMVAAFDFCRHGPGGAAPSIDTAMHGLVEAPHVDHLHPDSGIAIATAADGEQLTKDIYNEKVVWIPWRRPGFQLGLDIAAVQKANPDAVGCILGGHGITAWGATSAEAAKFSTASTGIAPVESMTTRNSGAVRIAKPNPKVPARSAPANVIAARRAKLVSSTRYPAGRRVAGRAEAPVTTRLRPANRRIFDARADSTDR